MGIWPFSSSDPRRTFWNWFQKNRERLHGVGHQNQGLVGEVSRHLKKVHPGLVPEFGMKENRAVELVISADGDRSIFPAVVDLVSMAPEVPGWKITAFRQPGIADAEIEMNGVRLSAGSLWFRSEPDEEKVGLTVLIPGLTEENKQHLSHMAFLLLDNALGEFLVETSVGFIDFEPLPESRESEDCHPFTSIADHVQQVVQ